MKYLLDSDIVIDYLRDFRPTVKRLDELFTTGDDIYISAVTNLELHAGESITQDRVLKQISGMFLLLSIIDVTAEIAALAGDYRRVYKMSVPDALIAATASSINAVLITRNIKHYSKLKELAIQSV